MSSNRPTFQERKKILEKERLLYLKKCQLTDKFFCEYDENGERVLKFVNMKMHENKEREQVLDEGEEIRDEKNNVVGYEGVPIPCCVNHSDTVSLGKYQTQRVVLADKLLRIQNHIKEFFKDSGDIGKAMGGKNPTIVFNDLNEQTKVSEKAQSLIKQLNELNDVSTKILETLTVCLRSTYVDSLVTLANMPYNVCEPLEQVVKELEASFYPRMLKVKSLIAEGKTYAIFKKTQGTASGYIMSFGTWVGKAAASVGSKLKSSVIKLINVLSLTFQYLYTNGVAGIGRVFRALGQSASALVTMLCAMNSNDKLILYYEYLYAVIDKSLTVAGDASSRLLSALKNMFILFKNGPGRKFATFLLDSCNSLISGLVTDKVAKETKEMNDADVVESMNEELKQASAVPENAALARLRALIQEATRINEQDFFKLTRETCTKWLWMICVYSFDMIKNIFAYGFDLICTFDMNKAINALAGLLPFSKDDEDSDEEQEGAKEEEEVVARVPVVAKNNIDQLKAVDESATEIKSDQDKLKQTPDLQVHAEKVVTNPNVEELKKQFERARLDVNLPKSTNEIVNVLFKCFWFFAQNGFIPKGDVEDELLSTYLDAPNGEVRTLPEVPKYVRYAYCRAQDRDINDCAEFVESSESTINGLPDAQDRYETDMTDSRQKFAIEKAERQAKLLASEAEVSKRITDALQNLKATQPEFPKYVAPTKDEIGTYLSSQVIDLTVPPPKRPPYVPKNR